MSTEELPRRLSRGIIAAVCALSLVAISVGAPLLGNQITGTSLFVLGFGWSKMAFLVGAGCSLLMVIYRQKQSILRATEALSLGFHMLSFAYGVMVSTMAVVQSDYPFALTQIGFIANVLSVLGYLCLGLLIWAVAGLLSRR